MASKSDRSKSSGGFPYGEVWGIALIGIYLVLLVSFVSYNPGDDPFFDTDAGSTSGNYTGKLGAMLARVFFFTIGLSAYIVAVFGII